MRGFNWLGRNNKINTPPEAIILGNSYERTEVVFSNCYNYYHQDATLATAVNKISSDVGRIGIIEVDNNNKELEKSEVISLFKEQHFTKLLDNIALSMLLAGNAFVLASGNINYLPTTLEFIHVERIDCINAYNNSDPIIKVRGQNSIDIIGEFSLDKKTGRWLNGNLAELIHIKGKNTSNSYFSESPLQPLIAKLDMKIQGDNHNVNLVANGFSGKGILTVNTQLDNSKREEVEKKIQGKYSGASNAGRVVVLGGTGGNSVSSNFHDLSKSNRDMDYSTLVNESDRAIYNFYSIPLPLVKEASMSFNNFSQANYQYFEHAVLPVTNNILSGFNVFFKNKKINFNELKIDNNSLPQTLQVVVLQAMQEAEKTSALTLNEIRKIGSYQDLKGDGQVVFSNIRQPEPIAAVTEEELQSALAKYLGDNNK